MLEKCVLTFLELIWNQRLGQKNTKLNICYHMLSSSTQLQNRSFHVVERTRTSLKCQKMKNARAWRVKILFFIVKYVNLWGFCCRRRRGCLSSLILFGRLGQRHCSSACRSCSTTICPLSTNYIIVFWHCLCRHHCFNALLYKLTFNEGRKYPILNSISKDIYSSNVFYVMKNRCMICYLNGYLAKTYLRRIPFKIIY